MRDTPAIQPLPDEPCLPLPSTSIAPPSALIQPGSESRLIQSLRDAAKQKKPLEILARAAVAHHQFLPQPGGASLGNALADLAVSGREAYKAFKIAPVSDAALVAATTTKMAAEHVSATPQEIVTAVGLALDRAYAVAWALRGPAPHREVARSALGWIAVSAEDDTPHRPVNVAAPSMTVQNGRTIAIEQYEIPVTVGSVTVQTRFFIASAGQYTARKPLRHVGGSAPRALPTDPTPQFPDDHRVILFLHGHSSSADEALPVIPDILKAGLALRHEVLGHFT